MGSCRPLIKRSDRDAGLSRPISGPLKQSRQGKQAASFLLRKAGRMHQAASVHGCHRVPPALLPHLIIQFPLTLFKLINSSSRTSRRHLNYGTTVSLSPYTSFIKTSPCSTNWPVAINKPDGRRHVPPKPGNWRAAPSTHPSLSFLPAATFRRGLTLSSFSCSGPITCLLLHAKDGD